MMETLHQTETLLRDLKLSGMLSSLSPRLKSAQKEQISYEGWLNLLLHDEKEHRKNAKIIRLLKRASFRQSASLEALDLSTPRGIDKKLLGDLGTCRFIREGFNVIISGPTGVGKSFLATALGNHACRNGISAAFFRMNSLIEKLALERAKGNYLNLLKRLSAFDLLIFDDFGIKPLEPIQYQDFYDIIDERSEDKSTIITTQLPVENWSEVVGDPVTCEAITDRLVSKGIRINMKGASYRQKGKSIDKV